MERIWVNDKREGKEIGYYEQSGKIKSEVNHVNGKRERKEVGYYD